MNMTLRIILNINVISWDYGKEITVTLEDALFSAKSMAIMFGSVDKDGNADIEESATVYKTVRRSEVVKTGGAYVTKIRGVDVTIPTTGSKTGTFYDEEGNPVSISDIDTSGYAYVTFPLNTKDVKVIGISAENFPGTYYITGDTYARPESGEEDEFFQFVIPKAKVQSEVTLTMEAEGDPSTFSMNLRVLRPESGEMMKLIKYDIDTTTSPAEG